MAARVLPARGSSRIPSPARTFIQTSDSGASWKRTPGDESRPCGHLKVVIRASLYVRPHSNLRATLQPTSRRGTVCVLCKTALQILRDFHRALMAFIQLAPLFSRLRRTLASSASLLLLCSSATAKSPRPWVDTKPLSVDTGVVGLKLTLRRLHTTARLMHTTAHPDDEDGGMLTLESRGRGVTALQLTLNRGEGGQNKVGSNLLDELGILRTLELLGADRYYGVEQRFTRVADFGFSKTPKRPLPSGAATTWRLATWCGSFAPFGPT